MKTSGKSVLFLTPGASSVGGNIFLLNFLRWFKNNSDIPFITIYGRGGDLEPAFKALGPAYEWEYNWDGLTGLSKNVQRLRKALRLNERSVLKELSKRQIGLIYSNTVINHEVLRGLSDTRVPLVAHCHELETLIQKHGAANFEDLKDRCEFFVAAADAVRRNLISNHGIPEEKVDVIREFIPIESADESAIRKLGRDIRVSMGIPDNAFVVGGSGTVYWRKGPDIFIQIAARVKRLEPHRPVKFIWIGGARTGDASLIEARYDIEKLGLTDMVQFIEHMPDPSGHYAALDVFALTSREDPFPLVCLETAAAGKPVICFADAGGMPEFVGEDAGAIVPYLDLDAFASKIAEFASDPSMTESLGRRAADRVRRDHDILVSAPRVLSVIERYLA